MVLRDREISTAVLSLAVESATMEVEDDRRRILEEWGLRDPKEVLERTKGLQWSIFPRRFQISVAESGVCEASVTVSRFSRESTFMASPLATL